jgi:iron complex outermembrane receptor protein
VQDASFFRLDNVTAAYTLEKIIAGKFDVNLSLTVQNALVITKYTGLDPEIFGGIDNNVYPRPRTFLLGLNVNF